ncbi:MAG: zinc ribbon domain-containing protein [Bacilli bacterium]|jgi:predicted amidophosphoribosyltransferase|nr:zinc ribbon domain-containing protein [Bacilli bacterium]
MEEKEYCPNCGKEVDPKSDYCTSCGYRIHQTNYSHPSDVSKKDSGLISLVFGVFGFLFPYIGLFFSIAAMVIGSKYKKDDSLSKTGFVLGLIAVIIQALEWIAIIVVIILAAVGIIPVTWHTGVQVSTTADAVLPFLF